MTNLQSSEEYASRYFREAATLRLCLEYNQDDYLFSQEGGRIIYIFDANVVRFFIDPEKEARHVVAFPSKLEPDYAGATAVITAEFLFSRSLAGQMRSPALIAPSHGDELGGIINAMMHESQPPDEAAPAIAEETMRKLRHLADAAAAGKLPRQEAVARLRRLVPDLANHLIRSGWSSTRQMRRLYDEDLLRPLALHPHATREILFPPQKDQSFWTRQILAELRAQHGSDGANSRIRQRAERDAEALVQAILLDEDVADTEPEQTRYVLVTADQVLFDAYSKWYWAQPPSPKRRFLLRLPLQYIPILNSLEMPNSITSYDLSSSAQNALDSLFANLGRLDKDYAAKLSFYRTISPDSPIIESFRAIFGENPMAFSDELIGAFQRVRKMWHETFSTGVVLNANLLNRRLQEFSFLAEKLTLNTNLWQEIYDDQKRNLDQIETAHAGFSTQIQILKMLREADAYNEPAPTGRAALLATVRLPRLLGDEPLRDALERLAANGPALLEQISAKLDEPDFQILMLAACIAHRCHHWTAAVLYARKAIEIGGRDDEANIAEAALLLCSATRFWIADGAADSEGVLLAYAMATQVLEEFRSGGDEFGLLRALTERASLALAIFFWNVVHEQKKQLEVPLGSDAFHSDFQQAREITETLSMHCGGNKDKRLILEEVAKQIEAGTVYGEVLARTFHTILPDTLSSQHGDDEFRAMLVAVEPLLRGYARRSAVTVGRWLIRDLAHDEAVAELEEIARTIENDHSTLTMDLLVLKSFIHHITGGQPALVAAAISA